MTRLRQWSDDALRRQRSRAVLLGRLREKTGACQARRRRGRFDSRSPTSCHAFRFASIRTVDEPQFGAPWVLRVLGKVGASI
jgi:hypothetical protein